MTGKRSTTRLKKFIIKLTRCMQLLQPIRPVASEDESDEGNGGRMTALVPRGHIAILAGKGEEERKRFVVELKYLKNPKVLKLLKEAEEAYGFQQEGALAVPCRPEELQKILEDNI